MSIYAASMSVRVDIVSIGALSRNLLWKETRPVRTSHSTCSLIRTRKRTILVDPGLPAPAMAARLQERTGLQPGDIDLIFLTNFRPSHRAGLAAFENATVFLHANESDYVRAHLERLLEELDPGDDDAERVRAELAVLGRCQNPPDKLDEQVDLFPLFGHTPGQSGLLVTGTTLTTLIAGDAIATLDHFLAGQLLPDPYNLEQAKASLEEAYEIADLIVPGHDNAFLNPRTHGI